MSAHQFKIHREVCNTIELYVLTDMRKGANLRTYFADHFQNKCGHFGPKQRHGQINPQINQNIKKNQTQGCEEEKFVHQIH